MGYFRCSSVETNEPYLSLIVLPHDGDKGTKFEIQIPHHAVLCILGNPQEKTLGFGNAE